MAKRQYCARCHQEKGTPYMYTQFCEKYRSWARVTKATMRITLKPGKVMQVDWAGTTIPYFDSVTGVASAAYLFVAALPCSGFTYAEACLDMKSENWQLCHSHAYTYFGGATRLLIPDNLKTGVTKNTRYETILNTSYQELAQWHRTRAGLQGLRQPYKASRTIRRQEIRASLPAGVILRNSAQYPLAHQPFETEKAVGQ